MGWWSHEILGGDPPLDELCRIERDCLGMSSLRPFDWDEKTCAHILERSKIVEEYALEAFSVDRDARLAAIGFFHAVVAGLLDIPLTQACADAAKAHMARARAIFESKPSWLDGLSLSNDIEIVTGETVRKIDDKLARALLRTFSWCVPQSLVAFEDETHALLGRDVPDDIGLVAGMLLSHRDIVTNRARERMLELDAIVPAFDRGEAMIVQVAGALLLSVGARLDDRFRDALSLACLNDPHPNSEDPRRLALMRYLVEAAHSAAGERISFSDDGLFGAFEKAKAEGRGGLVNIVRKKSPNAGH